MFTTNIYLIACFRSRLGGNPYDTIVRLTLCNNKNEQNHGSCKKLCIGANKISTGVLEQYGQFKTKMNVTRQLSGCNNDALIFRQLFDHTSSTYTYLLGCGTTRECILIDPVLEQVKRDYQLTKDLGLNLKYAANTHMHADHVTGSGYLRALSGCKTIISKSSGADADIYVAEKGEIIFGGQKLIVLSTPGHTNGCVTYYSVDQAIAFTGDALLIRGCGRTDFQEGDSRTLYQSVHSKIFTLPPATILFPAHDYKGQACTSVDEEKRLNPRLTKTEDEFIDIMNNLNLAYPKQIDRALPANKACGVYDIPKDL